MFIAAKIAFIFIDCSLFQSFFRTLPCYAILSWHILSYCNRGCKTSKTSCMWNTGCRTEIHPWHSCGMYPFPRRAGLIESLLKFCFGHITRDNYRGFFKGKIRVIEEENKALYKVAKLKVWGPNFLWGHLKGKGNKWGSKCKALQSLPWSYPQRPRGS